MGFEPMNTGFAGELYALFSVTYKNQPTLKKPVKYPGEESKWV
jgi:hypothetical protein